MQSPLPVPADRAIAQPIDPNALVTMFQSVQLDIDPALRQYAGQAAAICCNIIQQKAQTNAVRQFHFNLCSQNNWQNPTFQQLVGSVLEYAFYVDAQMNPVNLQNVIMNSANNLITMMASFCIQQYPDLQRFCNQQQGQAAMLEIQKLPQIQQLIQQRKQSAVQQPMGGFNQQPVHNAQVHWGTQPQQHMQQPGWGQAAMQPAHQMSMSAPTSGMFPNATMHDPRAIAPGTSTTGIVDDDDDDDISAFISAPSQEPVVEHNHATESKADAVFAAASMEAATDVVDAPDEVVITASPYTRDWSIEQPWGLVYNPREHALMHVKENGQINEQIISLESAMDYNEHELELTFPELSATDYIGERQEGSWNSIAKVQEITGDNVDDELELDAGTIVAITASTMIESNLSLSQHMARGWARENGVEIPEGAPFIYSVLVGEQSIGREFTGSFTSDSLNERFARGNLRELARMMQITRDEEGPIEERMPKVLFDVINQRATAAVNHALQVNMSLTDWAIDSFVEDYLSIKPALRKEYGDAMEQMFSDNENKVIQEILFSRTIGEYFGDDVDENDTSILFVNKASVLSLPWTSYDLNIQLPDLGAGYVSAAKLPGLHHALKEFMKVTDDSLSHYLMTVDGVAIEVNKGWLGPDCYLLNLA